MQWDQIPIYCNDRKIPIMQWSVALFGNCSNVRFYTPTQQVGNIIIVWGQLYVLKNHNELYLIVELPFNALKANKKIRRGRERKHPEKSEIARINEWMQAWRVCIMKSNNGRSTQQRCLIKPINSFSLSLTKNFKLSSRIFLHIWKSQRRILSDIFDRERERVKPMCE